MAGRFRRAACGRRVAGRGLRHQKQQILPGEDLYGRGFQSAGEGSAGAAGAESESVGDCILAINGQDLDAADGYSEAAGRDGGQGDQPARCRGGRQKPRDLSVTPIASEYNLRNIDWIEGNQAKVDELSGGKLAYVYLPDTGAGGFTNFNRYYFAQTDKQGAIIDERFNGGGQVADYFVEVLGRHIESYWAPRYGKIEHTPNAGIYGPKVMIANEFSGSGGDALPWLFKQAKLGTLVGKRTWGGLVGIGGIPVLMDGGHVTSPSVAFFSPKGEWDVENHGVDPDVVVEQDPKLVSEGHDPQLEKAVAIALEGIAQASDDGAGAAGVSELPQVPFNISAAARGIPSF
jgi:tricorn protease